MHNIVSRLSYSLSFPLSGSDPGVAALLQHSASQCLPLHHQGHRAAGLSDTQGRTHYCSTRTHTHTQTQPSIMLIILVIVHRERWWSRTCRRSCMRKGSGSPPTSSTLTTSSTIRESCRNWRRSCPSPWVRTSVLCVCCKTVNFRNPWWHQNGLKQQFD